MQLHGKQLVANTVTPDKLNFTGYTPTNPNDPITKSYFETEQLTIAAASQPYLEIVGGALSVKALAISTVTVDTTSADLSAAIAANYSNGDELQRGDTLILKGVAGGDEVYIHNGGSAGDATDFTIVQVPNLDDAYVRTLVSANQGITYNNSTGVFGLGGDITNDITLNLAGGQLAIESISANPNRFAVYLEDTSTSDYTEFFTNLGNVYMSTYLSSGAYKQLTVDNNFISMYATDGGSNEFTIGINYSESAGLAFFKAEVNDSRQEAYRTGLEYTGLITSNYSTLLDNSLVPKKYVDDLVGGAVSAPQTNNRGQVPAAATSGDGSTTAITLSAAPKGLIILAVNGKIESIGNGIKTQNAYFSSDEGTTAKTFATLASGDTLYWNGVVSGYELDTNDTIDIYYL
jgi:hypothetical protein